MTIMLLLACFSSLDILWLLSIIPITSRAKLPARCFHEAVVLGRRYAADEAFRAGILSLVCPGECTHVVTEALILARQVLPLGGYNRAYLKQSKFDAYNLIMNFNEMPAAEILKSLL